MNSRRSLHCCFHRSACGNCCFSFYKVDQQTGVGLSGAVFELRGFCGCVLFSTSSATGLVEFDVFPCCCYELTEVTAPLGYMRSNAVDQIKVDRCCIYVNGQCSPVFCLSNKRITVPVLGSFTATKIDSITGLPLAGAMFQLASNTDIIGSVVTQATGNVSFSNLSPGTYSLTETITPPGYQTPVTPISVVVAADGTVTFDGVPAQGFLILNVPFFGFSFRKVDAANDSPLAGAVFDLAQGGVSIGSALSAVDGIVSFTGLASGSYVLTETMPPTGYVPNPTAYSVIVANDGSVTVDGIAIRDFSVSNTAIGLSPTPAILSIYEDSLFVEGTGVPGCLVEVTFLEGNIVSTSVHPNGQWIFEVPESNIPFVVGSTVYATQTCDGLLPSDRASTVVRRIT